MKGQPGQMNESDQSSLPAKLQDYNVCKYMVCRYHSLIAKAKPCLTLDWKLTCASLLNPPVHCPWVLQLIQPGHTAKGKLFMARLQKATCAKRWTSGPLTFFVDFMPVNNCAQGLLHKLRVTWKPQSLHMSQDLQNCSSMFEDDFPADVIPHLGTPVG